MDQSVEVITCLQLTFNRHDRLGKVEGNFSSRLQHQVRNKNSVFGKPNKIKRVIVYAYTLTVNKMRTPANPSVTWDLGTKCLLDLHFMHSCCFQIFSLFFLVICSKQLFLWIKYAFFSFLHLHSIGLRKHLTLR